MDFTLSYDMLAFYARKTLYVFSALTKLICDLKRFHPHDSFLMALSRDRMNYEIPAFLGADAMGRIVSSL